MADWTPQTEGLTELLHCLEQSQSSDNQVQAAVRTRIDLFNANIPDYNNYLAYVLVTPIDGVQSQYRSVAGYLLQTNIRLKLQTWPPSVVEYVRSVVFRGLADHAQDIRRTASSVVAWLTIELGLDKWPDALPELIKLLDSPSVPVQEAAFNTIAKICEDMPRQLEQAQYNGQRPLDYLIPKLIASFDSDNVKIRILSLQAISPFIVDQSMLKTDGTRPPTMSTNIDAFLQALFKRASDPSPDVRRLVCSSMVQLLSSWPERLLPDLGPVVDYMLHCCKETDPDLAREACEFWLAFAEDANISDALKPYLDRIAPVLLDGMVYDEDELLMLDEPDEDNAAVPDRPEDIKPRFVQGRQHAQQHDPASAEASGSAPPANGTSNQDADEDEEEEEDDEEEDEDTSWTLRKCSAAALDVLANHFGDELLTLLLPHLKTKLWSDDWLQRESGILALGAIADGCINGIEAHLPVLVPYLLQMLQDAKPLVRSIACWTLGRYSSWTIPTPEQPGHKATYLLPAVEGLLRMVLDNNKRVQQAGCSAFATLVEEAGPELNDFLDPILRNLVIAFGKYQTKNLFILYDAIGTLSDAVGTALNNKAYIDIIMPPLISKWQSLLDDDPAIIPLLECMSSVVIAIGDGFGPYAQPVFERCVRICSSSLTEFATFQNEPAHNDEPDRTFLVVALDLLSGLTQGLGSSISPLVANVQPPLLTVLSACLKHPDAPVRQSAYALLGDSAISCFPLLVPVLPAIMPDLVEQIELEPHHDVVSVCNNASWAAGEIALKHGAQMEQFAPALLERLIPLMVSPKVPRSLTENSAVTIGRVGLVCPAVVAPHLAYFIQPWCTALADIKDNEEKDSAFRGICMVIQANPNGLSNHFQFFLNAVARWQKPSPELFEMFRSILNGFKSVSGDTWPAIMEQFNPAIRQRLAERYQV
ncbi:uncharacterized protein L969DRAFT_94300 [Mixia osmundae IAM 14324]|uniref:Importin N-terminal domain-containing protein n=1 Tax=Mixia osmundae (strain CBS 9802 / IAM 14324 / JCM 22182 / KY 12970) TaxID=764103 RepID=G7E8G2_MIXOS|nr:uncharacterized protein L969DRAFT_94300 [Mixia osmundae IAM 14324]KEI39224.1 hypothetical protein L969DRAFT_94300 [Mixia osmundae IAM 14324]GAA99122.1 hypothetical protein E5Q_05812 [Mixia osmundae IAM 14324]